MEEKKNIMDYDTVSLDDDGSVNFAQWCDVESASGSTGVLGQYPDPCKDADKANKAFSSTKISSWG